MLQNIKNKNEKQTAIMLFESQRGTEGEREKGTERETDRNRERRERASDRERAIFLTLR